MRLHKLCRTAALTIAAVVLIAAGAGCPSGPATGQVQGQVTFKGNPVSEGTVSLLNPTQGGGAEAKINPDGTFTVAGGVVAGEYLVVITPPMQMVDTDPGRSPPAPMEKPAPNIPAKYRMQGTTPLRAPVKPGANDFTFDMTP